MLKNAAVDRLLEKEKALGAKLQFQDIIEEVAGVYPKIMTDGDMEAGAWSCGMVVGLIHDIPSCKELIDGIMAEATLIIRGRLEGMLNYGSTSGAADQAQQKQQNHSADRRADDGAEHAAAGE